MVIFGAIIILSITAGLWVFAGFAVFFCALFVISAPFVFGKKWEAPEPTSAPRPILRKRS